MAGNEPEPLRHDLSVNQIGGHPQHQRDLQPERLGGSAVDDEFELGRLLHWQVGRLSPFEDAASIDADFIISKMSAP
jgi:hypothetical protein